MSLAVLFHFLCAEHVSDINISISRSLRLCCWITTLDVLFSVRCVLEIWCGWVWVVSVLQAEHGHHSKPAAPNLQDTTNREQNNRCGSSTANRKLLMMDILMSETCWVHKKWNKTASDIKLVFYSSTVFHVNMTGPLVLDLEDPFQCYSYRMTICILLPRRATPLI